MVTAHAMTNADDGSGHLISLQVDQEKKISSMIIPVGIIAQQVLVQLATLTLLCGICNPYASNTNSSLICLEEKIIPEWFIYFLQHMSMILRAQLLAVLD